MRDNDLLAVEVRRAIEGDPWFGPSAMSLLAGMEAGFAYDRAPGVNHSIWEIVRHMTSWARYVAYRVAGGAPREPAEGDWPPVPSKDAVEWAEAVADLRRSHEELVRALDASADGALDVVAADTPVDDSGDPVTLRRAVVGVAQHDAYHCGQIAVLKQSLAAASADSIGVARQENRG